MARTYMTYMLAVLVLLLCLTFVSNESMAQQEILDQAASWWSWLVSSIVNAADTVKDWVVDVYDDWT